MEISYHIAMLCLKAVWEFAGGALLCGCNEGIKPASKPASWKSYFGQHVRELYCNN